jgi:hypothetical protein
MPSTDKNITFQLSGVVFRGFATQQGNGVNVVLQDDGLYRIEMEQFGLKKWERLQIEYGKNGSSWSWNDNILTVSHSLNCQFPLVYVYVQLKTGTVDETSKIELAIIPHNFTLGNYDQVTFDFTGFENYYMYIRILG